MKKRRKSIKGGSNNSNNNSNNSNNNKNKKLIYLETFFYIFTLNIWFLLILMKLVIIGVRIK